MTTYLLRPARQNASANFNGILVDAASESTALALLPDAISRTPAPGSTDGAGWSAVAVSELLTPMHPYVYLSGVIVRPGDRFRGE